MLIARVALTIAPFVRALATLARALVHRVRYVHGQSLLTPQTYQVRLVALRAAWRVACLPHERHVSVTPPLRLILLLRQSLASEPG